MTEQRANFEELFKQIVATTTLLKDSLKTSNYDALAENIHDFLSREVYVENGAPDEDTVEKLDKFYSKMSLSGFTERELFELMQLLILKAEKEDQTSVNNLMTPPAVAVMTSLILYELVQQLGNKTISIVDPAVGSGNLLLEIVSNIRANVKTDISAIGIDNDDMLLSMADSFSQLVGINTDLFHQDSVMPWPANDIDYVVSDLPVGFYPVDENAEKFETKSNEGHSYSHHLLIENSMNHLKDNGVGIFIVPSEIFKTKESEALAKWMVSNVYLQGILTFPSDMFHSEAAQKSVVILQKHGSRAKQAEKVLMGEIPSLKNMDRFSKFQAEIASWVKKNF